MLYLNHDPQHGTSITFRGREVRRQPLRLLAGIGAVALGLAAVAFGLLGIVCGLLSTFLGPLLWLALLIPALLLDWPLKRLGLYGCCHTTEIPGGYQHRIRLNRDSFRRVR